MLTDLVHSAVLPLSLSVVRTALYRSFATYSSAVQIEQVKSDSSVRPLLLTSLYRLKQDSARTGVVRATLPNISRSVVPTAPSVFFATYLTTTQTE